MSTEVPFLDVGQTYFEINDELDAAYQRVMNSGWYILGEEVNSFEEEFAAYFELSAETFRSLTRSTARFSAC